MLNFTPVDFDPFGEVKIIEKITPTNEPQREIWLSCIIGGEDANLSYNESVSLEITGELNFNALNKAVNDLVLRHEALRSTISPNGESLIIYKNLPVDFELVDISDLDSIAQKSLLKSFIRRVLDTPLDLYEGPLFKVYLHKLHTAEHFLTIVKHHAIGDGWSTGVILEDLSKMYNAYSNGENLNLDRPAQISDYAIAQAKFKKSDDFRKTENFWLDIFKNNVPVLDLQTDYPRQSPRTYKGNRIDYPYDKDFINKVKSVGAKAGCSLVTTLLSAFEVFLYQKTNQKELVVGLPSSGQSATEMCDLVGHCVNLLPLKTTINTEKDFIDYLKKRKGEVLDAYDNQRLTFGELIKKLYIPRDPSRITLVPVVFNIDMGMDNSVKFDGLNYKLISNPRAYENFEIFLNATSSKDGLVLEWSYNTGLFKEETIESFNSTLKTLLEKIILNPESSIAQLTDKEDVFFEAADEVFIAEHESVNTLIAQSVISYPDKTAFSFEGIKLSYQQLDNKVNQLASYLVEKGIGKGDIVAISVDRSTEMLVSLLSILKTGAVYLPLDPEYPVDRIEFMLEDSNAKLLLLSDDYYTKYQSNVEEVVINEIWPQLQSYSKTFEEKEIKGSDLAYILYTSGSTGKPKGVKITHRNLANFLISMKTSPGIKGSDRLLAITTISFDIAGLELYLPLISGAELVLANTESTKDGRILLKVLEEEKITMLQATPSTLQMILDSGWDSKFDLKILSGGEALPKDLAIKLLNLSTELWNMYGPTETTIWSTVKEIEAEDKIVSIGWPINNTQVYIVDENGNRLANNEVGEIYIGGEGVAAGYLNRPELTNEKFVPDNFSKKTGKKLYRTGDLGKILDNGEIQCLGRIDHQVKIRGHRIELGEIESIISKQNGVKQAVVLAREDIPNDKRLIAYLTLENKNDDVNDSAWKAHWDTLYEIGAENKSSLDVSDQNIDGTLLEHLANSEDLKKQAAEWIETSVERIKEQKSKRIYEIGSGAGQILYELAPETEYYIATDYAQAAIDNINLHLNSEPEKWSNVKALAASADDFSAIGNTPVDLVLIHSVAQYFADADYLLNVIKQSLKSITDGGCIFIGDMQGKNSLRMCHAMDHLPRDSDSNTVEIFNNTVDNRVRIEEEFVADPAFFYALPKLFPQIKGVDVQLRKGSSLNETTKYHYDIWLYVNKPVSKVKSQILKYWSDVKEVEQLELLLNENPDNNVIEIRNIFNSRTAKDYHLIKFLEKVSVDTRIRDVKAKINSIDEGLSPDLFWALGEKIGYNAHVRWTSDGTDGLFDVVFIPITDELVIPEFAFPDELKKNIYDFARTPISQNEIHLEKEIVQHWKQNLSEHLPAYMIPEEFIALKTFPLTPNAKIDRKALPKPSSKKAVNTSEKQSRPFSENEKLVVEIWKDILGLDNLKPTDDFFELGGHSLLAVKVMVTIEKSTGKRLPLATLFNNSTIEKLARQLSDGKTESKWDALVPIKTDGGKTPLFLIHGGGLNILLFKSISTYFDKDQPVYGLQALGLNHPTDVPTTINEIAKRYIKEILEVNPNGPYALAGYSLGGFIAFEIAKELKLLGKEIKLLGIMDTYAGNNEVVDDKANHLFKKFKRQFHKVPFFTKSFISNPKETIDYQLTVTKNRIEKIRTNSVATKDVLTEYETEIYKNYNIAHNNYYLAPADLKVTLFRVAKRLYYLDDLIHLGWGKFAKQGVEVHEIPGDHKTFLFPPNDKEFAEILQKKLNSI
ncbi:non-ribosomal peptide synthetase [Pedobacter sp. Leaf170]|uniref:non-ribosomal peptide synthetase n=1 Tax=Pedobacter sp. Leaf170 TaxID=2876558 RepID=UPI001E6288ED|nr:non-ribosomal peptide synthetase [Pedobacter sp. Leaf170]